MVRIESSRSKPAACAGAGAPPARPARARRWVCAVLVSAGALAFSAGCNETPLRQTGDAGALAGGLPSEQASRVLARIGDKTITLGDFAHALERMDQFDRLRYQTPERRRELLNEMIDMELLAMEAKRRGLDKRPETEEAVRQVLRDAMLAQARKGLPAPAEIPADEVRAYYEANVDRFREPERRRVGAIVMTDRKEAQKVLAAARKIKSAAEWGELFHQHSITAPKQKSPATPVDLAGDLGIVGPPDDPKGANPNVPDPVRAAVFRIGDVGGVGAELVEAEGKLYIVRMNGITAAHSRSLKEADRSIRVLLLQQKMREREQAVENELRKQFPVQIDDAALASVKLPAALEKGVEAATGPSRAHAPDSHARHEHGDDPSVDPKAEPDAKDAKGANDSDAKGGEPAKGAGAGPKGAPGDRK